MPQILVEDLSKSYRILERDAGALGALRGLFRRRYRIVEALKSISFSLERGELLGFIGPNGAGKSTTIKILSGILQPDGGRCDIDGVTPWIDRIRHVARIGVVFGQRTQLWWDLPVVEGFDLLRDIYGVGEADYRRTRDEMIVLMRLERLLDQPVRQLSLAVNSVPRRTDHRARRAIQAGSARFRQEAQPRAGRHRDPDDPRHARYRGAGGARDCDRQRRNPG
jgi:ABC-2 type transport system ATP-binding protein